MSSVLPHYLQRTYTLPDGSEVMTVHRAEAETLWAEIGADPHSPYKLAAAGLTAADTIIDVGAHIGLAALTFAGQAPGARVIAVEPAPKTFECLSANLSRYLPEAIVVNKAIAAEPGTAELIFHPNVASASTLYDDTDDISRNMEAYFVNANSTEEGRRVGWESFNVTEQVTVEVTTLAEIIRAYDVDRIGLLKIDVERGELAALQGLDDASWPLVQRLFLEVHDIDGRVGTIVTLLAERGFRATVTQTPVFRGGSVFQILADRP